MGNYDNVQPCEIHRTYSAHHPCDCNCPYDPVTQRKSCEEGSSSSLDEEPAREATSLDCASDETTTEATQSKTTVVVAAESEAKKWWQFWKRAIHFALLATTYCGSETVGAEQLAIGHWREVGCLLD
jgi:hypothetical protein